MNLQPNSFRLGDEVEIVKRHRYRGRANSALRVGQVGKVTALSSQETNDHRFDEDDEAHVVFDNSHWIEEGCLRLTIPVADVAAAIASIVGTENVPKVLGSRTKHCPTCTCEEP